MTVDRVLFTQVETFSNTGKDVASKHTTCAERTQQDKKQAGWGPHLTGNPEEWLNAEQIQP